MGGLIYQFNYLVPSGIYMYLLCEVWNLNVGDKPVWKLFILGFIAGAWHEGFAIPVLIGSLIVLIFYKQFRTQKTVTILSGIVVGLTWLMICPGVYVRMSYDCRISLVPGHIFDQLCRHSAVFRSGNISDIYIKEALERSSEGPAVDFYDYKCSNIVLSWIIYHRYNAFRMVVRSNYDSGHVVYG